ncbi:MAG TPA: OmpH family outer membrane protein [Negativicutes bacterium]|nr:OmpH family outer membrane protein [Negativicutes bacterium]
MRFKQQRKIIAALVLGCILFWSAGCTTTPSSVPVSTPPAIPIHAIVDMQKLLERHPDRARLRQMEQSLMAADAKAADNTSELEADRREFEVAMKVRQNEDKATLDKKQKQLSDELNEQRRLFIETLETEYRPLLFNIDLKLKTVQLSPTDTQTLQKERDRLDAERRRKLEAKDMELSSRMQSEMEALAAELSQQSEAYARRWMDERSQRVQKTTVSPEREKQRQEIVELSGRMIQDIRAAVTKVAVKEKIDMVWLRPAVHAPLKDITDAVISEIVNAK